MARACHFPRSTSNRDVWTGQPLELIIHISCYCPVLLRHKRCITTILHLLLFCQHLLDINKSCISGVATRLRNHTSAGLWRKPASTMLIRQGKDEGWLQLPPDAFASWASLNDVVFKCVHPGAIPGRGGALLATRDLDLPGADGAEPLMVVPNDLIMSLERVQQHAKVDQDFREVLESLGEFGRVGHLHIPFLFEASCTFPK